MPTITGILGIALGAGGVAAANALGDASVAQAEVAASASAASAAESAAAAQAAVLTDAVSSCGLSSAGGIDLGDGGTSLTFDMKGEKDLTGASISAITCIFGALDMPSAVLSHVEQTTSMDGRQTESWDNLTISWSYHPDRGLDGVLTVSAD